MIVAFCWHATPTLMMAYMFANHLFRHITSDLPDHKVRLVNNNDNN